MGSFIVCFYTVQKVATKESLVIFSKAFSCARDMNKVCAIIKGFPNGCFAIFQTWQIFRHQIDKDSQLLLALPEGSQ